MEGDQLLHGEPGGALDLEGLAQERRLEEVAQRTHDDPDQDLLVFLLDGLGVLVLEEAETVGSALALLPLVLKGDVPGNEIERPMALVILGGLVTSTLLNLFLLPSLYMRFGGKPNKTLSFRLLQI